MVDWTTFDRHLAPRRRAIVEGLVEFVRLNSVSQEPAKVRVTGEWLSGVLRARGLQGRLFETAGNPIIFGERRVPGATRTVLIYCHYDTKPIPRAGWLQSLGTLFPIRPRRRPNRPACSVLVDHSLGDSFVYPFVPTKS